MNYFLRYLVTNLRTIDGIKGSAEGILKVLKKQSKEKPAIIEQKLFRKIYKKYLLMKVRNKISYMALLKRYTIVELFCTTIQRVYF